MEALGRLSCKIAHDFNNILGTIEGYATLAMPGVGEDDPLAQDLREIHASVAKAAALSRQLIAFGGRQLLHKTPCGVNDIIMKTLKRAELAPGGDFKIEARPGPGLPGIMADAAQLEVALANLLVNAREAMLPSAGDMPGGGTAVISSSALRLEGGAVNSPDPLAAGTMFIKIAVRDSGAGITPEVLERLFEPLFSTRKKRQGAGLGLSMVYGLVKQHNGWVEVKSEPGQGSEFSLYLPAVNC
ncbi:MAG: ATP-binding protein [Elusimicrobia bacterium]|nr:ATP-binding protein [Elusimicrobiota bacterium]